MFKLISTEEIIILQEVKDHAAYWNSDRCKRATVEAHLRGPTVCHPSRAEISNVTEKIDWLVAQGKLQCIPTRSGDYLKIP